jgi:hypothetical protein
MREVVITGPEMEPWLSLVMGESCIVKVRLKNHLINSGIISRFIIPRGGTIVSALRDSCCGDVEESWNQCIITIV